jgi:hypothetical protein
MSLDAFGHRFGRRGQAVVLCGYHPEQLPAAGYYSLLSADLSIGKGLWSGTYSLGEAHQDGRVDPISLGEPPRGPGEVAHLRGIDHHYHRQSCRSQSPNHRSLEAAGGHKDHKHRVRSSRRRETKASIPLSSS